MLFLHGRNVVCMICRLQFLQHMFFPLTEPFYLLQSVDIGRSFEEALSTVPPYCPEYEGQPAWIVTDHTEIQEPAGPKSTFKGKTVSFDDKVFT